MKYIDIETWKRKDQYLFFKDSDIPFYNICVDVDVTNLREFTKKNDVSFFRAYFFLSLKAVNATSEFCLRIRDNGLVQHDVIHAGSTVLNENETFSFCYFDFSTDFLQFDKHVIDVLQKNKEYQTFDPKKGRDDLVYYSVLPWISFRSVSHTYRKIPNDSIPRIVFGKYYETNGRLLMPHSIEVNHALVDGFHVGKYIEQFQSYLENPSILSI